MEKGTEKECEKNTTTQGLSGIKKISSSGSGRWKKVGVILRSGKSLKNRAKSKETVYCGGTEEKEKVTSNNLQRVEHLGHPWRRCTRTNH